MHKGIAKQDRGRLGLKWIVGLVVACVITVGAQAQRVIVLTDADLGKEIASVHRFSDAAPNLTLSLKHRLGAVGPMEIQSVKAGQFGGPFQISQTLPLTLMPGETRDLTLSVNYGKSIKEASEILLALVPAGDKDPKRAINLKISLSAEGRLMFWDERNQRYSASMPTMTFDGAGEKLIEIAWNGAEPSPATFAMENDVRGGFKVVPNASGAKPIANGTLIPLGKGGSSYFIKYDGAAKKNGGVDIGRATFKDNAGKYIALDLYGTFKGGAALAASGTGPGKVGMLNLGTGKDALKAGGSNPGAAQEVITHSSGIPGVDPRIPTFAANTGTAVPKTKPAAVSPPRQFTGSITDPVLAKAHLASFFERRKGVNLIPNAEIVFRVVEGRYESRFKVVLDSLQADKAMSISPIWVSAVSGEDSLQVPMTNVEFDRDSLLLKVILPSEAESVVEREDSFLLHVGFLPEYLAGNQPVTLDNPDSVFRGSTIGRLVAESYWLLFLWLGIIGFIVLFFVLGWLWVRKPIKTFRYLRESRYQRERYAGRDEDLHIEIETVHVDLSRRETDLIQLAFNLHGDDGVTGPKDAAGKVKSLEATVTAPRMSGFRRFFVWFFGLFGRPKEPRFRSVYYSLRIEPIPGTIPQALHLKDESGILLLGTTLTGNVLATDHQDFRFTQRPFFYRIYVDPAEILDYSGSMRTVTIPFRVIEEPFEGYVMTRDFRLNLEVHNKG